VFDLGLISSIFGGSTTIKVKRFGNSIPSICVGSFNGKSTGNHVWRSSNYTRSPTFLSIVNKELER
jgi:hypothetical protein